MKLMPILEEMKVDEIRNLREVSVRKKYNIPDDEHWITAYHGTSLKNVKGIERSGFRSGTWFSTDKEVAHRYSLQVAGKPYVMLVRLYIGSLYPSGDYLVSQEVLQSTSQGYVPKDMVNKVYNLK